MTSAVTQAIRQDSLKIFRASAKALRELKKVDPRDRYVVLCPDSDRVHVGMNFSLLNSSAAEKVFEEASALLKKDIIRLCLDGPKSDLLDCMENRQLAAFVTTHATLAKLTEEQPDTVPFCKAAGGFGIGYVNTLVFSGSMSFENGLDLVKMQARAFDKIIQVVPNARLKIRLWPATSKSRLCRAAIEHCLKQGIPEDVAICNVTKQYYAHVIEVAGHEEAIKYLETEGERLFKFRWFARVQSNKTAINTHLMKPVQDFVRVYIDQKTKEDINYLKEPQTCSVYSSTSGYRTRGLKAVKKDLIKYPVEGVKTEQLLHCLFARPIDLPQPNTLVLWDKNLLRTLSMVNNRAWRSAKLYR